ncbi:hypothetical protein CYY_006811 [Polysphondylium violaceum]|uniref:Transmembrane protein n=1 Tax=Polysphondylium violaceum TaxID=133409 RepID=A0A8J4PSV3_9MYCE|nr:hypothetical protein CYY_006811 [Polysphondylium violaceum]
MIDITTKYLVQVFHTISDPIDERHWFLSPEQHALEFIYMNLTYILVIIFGSYLLKGRKSKITVVNDKKDHILVKLVALVLAINVIMNLIYKTSKSCRQLFFMLQPCHVVSCVYIFCLLTNNYQRGLKVFKVSIYMIFVTVAALVRPDTTDLTLQYEVLNFYIQHYALLFAPFILQIYRYNIEFEWGYALISSGIFGIAHFFFFEIFSFISGININYMLFPPPLGSFDHMVQETYRIIIAVLLFFLSWLLGLAVIKISNVLRPFLIGSAQSNPKLNKKTK